MDKPKQFNGKSILFGVIGVIGSLGIGCWGVWGWTELFQGNFEVLSGPIPITFVSMLITLAIGAAILFFLFSIITGYDREDTIKTLKSFFSVQSDDSNKK
jgi:uncharacterized membrane protein